MHYAVVARLFVILLAALAAATAALAQNEVRVGKQFDARVVRVADGDTLELIPLGETRQIRVRLEGVDAPELGEVFSREAQNFTRALIGDQRIRVEGRDVDRYGRLVVRITAAGKDASTELLRAGLACQRFAKDSALASAESMARAAGRGFWAANAQKPGCVAGAFPGASRQPASPRQVAPTAAARGFRGNVTNQVYHAASCPSFNCRNCTRVFLTEVEAQAAGFKPAGDCLKK